jgi:hypothetical protein
MVPTKKAKEITLKGMVVEEILTNQVQIRGNAADQTIEMAMMVNNLGMIMHDPAIIMKMYAHFLMIWQTQDRLLMSAKSRKTTSCLQAQHLLIWQTQDRLLI